ncbi:hypothetical protein SUGI_0097610 [Cryptomeria japonica]|nr:hypothetical protein SUGI_0097610 [Cryptomeria japonica]
MTKAMLAIIVEESESNACGMNYARGYNCLASDFYSKNGSFSKAHRFLTVQQFDSQKVLSVLQDKHYGNTYCKQQRGTKFHPGNNVGLGKDYTIFSLIDGLVKFEKYGPDKKKVSVYPRVVQPENPNSRKVRQHEYYRLRREQQKAKKMRISSPVLTLASSESKEPSVENEIC